MAYRKTREFRTQQELLFRSAEDAARLSHMRYNGGVTGYLEVLTNETNAFSTELGLVQAQLNELLAVVQLYQALGGGWQQWPVIDPLISPLRARRYSNNSEIHHYKRKPPDTSMSCAVTHPKLSDSKAAKLKTVP